MVHAASINLFSKSEKIAALVSTAQNNPVSVGTVHRWLCERRLQSRGQEQASMLTARHRKNWLEFAHRYGHWQKQNGTSSIHLWVQILSSLSRQTCPCVKKLRTVVQPAELHGWTSSEKVQGAEIRRKCDARSLLGR